MDRNGRQRWGTERKCEERPYGGGGADDSIAGCRCNKWQVRLQRLSLSRPLKKTRGCDFPSRLRCDSSPQRLISHPDFSHALSSSIILPENTRLPARPHAHPPTSEGSLPRLLFYAFFCLFCFILFLAGISSHAEPETDTDSQE